MHWIGSCPIGRWLPGDGGWGTGNYYLMGPEFQFGKVGGGGDCLEGMY